MGIVRGTDIYGDSHRMPLLQLYMGEGLNICRPRIMPEASVHGTESAQGSLATLPLLFSKHDLCVSISVGASGIFTSLFSSFGEKGLECASLTLTYLNFCSKNTRCFLIQFLSSWCDKLSQTWTESHCWWLESPTS